MSEKRAREYRKLRERAGSQDRVARVIEALGDVAGPVQETISRRERGRAPISGEAILAMRYLAEHPELVK